MPINQHHETKALHGRQAWAKSYQGGQNGENHPFAWYHDFDGGRAFYTGAGHTDESYTETPFLQHLLGGIKYAMGEK